MFADDVREDGSGTSESLKDLLPKLRRWLGIYVTPRTYATVINFLVGYDLGRGDGVFRGFHAWLMLRGHSRPELFWPWLVLCEVYPEDRLPVIRDFTPEQDAEMIQTLFDLLGEYLGVEPTSEPVRC